MRALAYVRRVWDRAYAMARSTPAVQSPQQHEDLAALRARIEVTP